MKTQWISPLVLVVGLALGVSACSQPETVVVPTETQLLVSVTTTTRSDLAREGESLTGRLEENVVVDGEVVLAAGQTVTLEVLEAAAVVGTSPAKMELGVVAVDLPGGATEVETEPVEIVGDLGTVDVVVVPAGQRLTFSTTSDLEIPRPGRNDS